MAPVGIAIPTGAERTGLDEGIRGNCWRAPEGELAVNTLTQPRSERGVTPRAGGKLRNIARTNHYRDFVEGHRTPPAARLQEQLS
jgi:hypothetical protein